MLGTGMVVVLLLHSVRHCPEIVGVGYYVIYSTSGEQIPMAPEFHRRSSSSGCMLNLCTDTFLAKFWPIIRTFHVIWRKQCSACPKSLSNLSSASEHASIDHIRVDKWMRRDREIHQLCVPPEQIQPTIYSTVALQACFQADLHSICCSPSYFSPDTTQ